MRFSVIRAIVAVFAFISLLPTCIGQSATVKEHSKLAQAQHLEYLKNEYYTDYTPVNEQAIADFDLSLADEIRFNELRFIGSHNSYKAMADESYINLYEQIEKMTFGIVKKDKALYNPQSLTQQLEAGARTFEIDIEVLKDDGLVVTHDPLLDPSTNCYYFKGAMEEIFLWSTNNPNHLPITVIIEPKTAKKPFVGMQSFDMENAKIVDDILRSTFGDKLITPADVMGDFESLKEMRQSSAWPTVSDLGGKIFVLLHDTDITDKYIGADSTLKTQAMFPMLRYEDVDKSYASFIIDNEPDSALKRQEEYAQKGLIVRTRADSGMKFSQKRYDTALESGANIISSDYIKRTEPDGNHEFTFSGGYTVALK